VDRVAGRFQPISGIDRRDVLVRAAAARDCENGQHRCRILHSTHPHSLVLFFSATIPDARRSGETICHAPCRAGTTALPGMAHETARILRATPVDWPQKLRWKTSYMRLAHAIPMIP